MKAVIRGVGLGTHWTQYPEIWQNPFERYVNDRLESTELHEGTTRFWDAEAVSALLKNAGFVAVTKTNVFTDDEPVGENR